MMEFAGSFQHAASAFLNRGQLHSGDVFVGRRRELLQLEGSLCKRGNVQSSWLSGPRQIGKSSLAARVSFVDQTGGTRIDLSMGGDSWQGLDALADQILERLSDNAPGRGFTALYKHLERLTKPVLVSIDEFDGVAVQLKKDDQAGLRKLADKLPHFGWLFITRAQPTQLCQDFGEDNSRLVSVCHPLRLGFLSPTDVGRLVGQARQLAGIEIGDELAEWIYAQVGGYPVVAQALLAHILIEAEERNHMPTLSQLDDEVLAERLFGVVKNDLVKLWVDLPQCVRRYIEHNGERIMLDTETRTEFSSLNMLSHPVPSAPVIPAWFRRVVPRSLSLTIDAELGLFGPSERLLGALRACGEPDVPTLRGHLFQVDEVEIYRFARPTRSIPEFIGLLSFLDRLMLHPFRPMPPGLRDHPAATKFLSNAIFHAISELMSIAQSSLEDGYIWMSLSHRGVLGLARPPVSAEDFLNLQRTLLELCALAAADLAEALRLAA